MKSSGINIHLHTVFFLTWPGTVGPTKSQIVRILFPGLMLDTECVETKQMQLAVGLTYDQYE